jgi:Arc/MetJ family transcription regulator
MRTNVVLDNELVTEALALTGAKNKSELVRLAIVELVRSRKRKNLLDLAGQIEFRDDFDHKQARELRDGPG